MRRTARAWSELMARLSYDSYGVRSGDVGAGVSGMVANEESDDSMPSGRASLLVEPDRIVLAFIESISKVRLALCVAIQVGD